MKWFFVSRSKYENTKTWVDFWRKQVKCKDKKLKICEAKNKQLVSQIRDLKKKLKQAQLNDMPRDSKGRWKSKK